MPWLSCLRYVLVCAIAVFSVVLAPFSFAATASILGEPVNAANTQAGTLLVRAEDDLVLRPVPMLGTEVDIEVAGIVARTVVTQYFHNPTDLWLEGVYVFPLPEHAAVDTLEVRIGDRLIVGEIKERSEAKKIYEKAKAEGKKAALLEQERANIFTTSVAGIPPGSTVGVRIEYQRELLFRDGFFSLRFPMVVAPRYIPGDAQATSSGFGFAPDTDQVPDGSRITPGVALPSDKILNPVKIKATINAGMTITAQSPSHLIGIDKNQDRVLITLADGVVPADRDFVLRWQPVIDKIPAMALFKEHFAGEDYALLMMMPPQAEAGNTQPLAREVIFVLDRSGSMAGRSFSQAKAALILALKQLRPEDAFNLIAFSSDARQLFSESMPATDANIDNALDGIADLNAEGGTEMHYALSLALENQRPTEKVRQVVFITDGAVGNEAMLFDFIKTHLGQSRLFTVGIGSAPNSHFMTDAALLGKGTYTYISNLSEVKREMTALFRRLESPLLTDIKIDFNGAPVETYPEYIADLYAGEPLVVLLKAQDLDQDIVVRGATGTNHWTQKVRLKNGHAHEGIARLYARRKVAAIERSLYGLANAASWRETQKAIKSEIIATGLQYQIVTKHTSLVAVEQESTVPFGENLKPWAAPINLPAGWEYGLDQSGPDTDALSQDLYYEDAAIGDATLMSASKVFARQERVDASAMSVADFSAAPATVAAVTESTDWCSRYPASFACVDDKHNKDQKGGTSKTQSSPPSAMQIAMGQILPRTATPAQMLLIIGMLLLMTAAVTRKKKLLKWR